MSLTASILWLFTAPFNILRWLFASRSQGRIRLGDESSNDAGSIPHQVPPPVTTEKLEWADLPIIDFSALRNARGLDDALKKLSKEICDAMKSHGFFYVVGHGHPAEKTKRIFDLASATFDLVEPDEKKKYEGTDPTVYKGYKPKQTWKIDGGALDQIEHYNMNRQIQKGEHPSVLRPHLAEIEEFARFNHFEVLFPVLRLLALGLDLPVDTFVEQHRFEDEGESSLRFMKYYPRSKQEETVTKNVWLKGHTDIGSITILWSQPISGLQIYSPDRQWRWIKHIDNALVVNTGDVMTLLSRSAYKPTIHRVRQPPKDQENRERLGVFYFAMASDNVVVTEKDDGSVVTMGDWRKERTGRYGRGGIKQSNEETNVEQEEILGVVVKEYN